MTSTHTTPLIIDVRSPGEFATGHVRGSVNIPLDRFAQAIAEAVPDKSAPVILCCASGGRSGMACDYMQQMGYANHKRSMGKPHCIDTAPAEPPLLTCW